MIRHLKILSLAAALLLSLQAYANPVHKVKTADGTTIGVEACADGIYRIHISPRKDFAESLMERYGLIKTDWTAAGEKVSDGKRTWTLSTPGYKLSIDKKSGTISLLGADGKALVKALDFVPGKDPSVASLAQVINDAYADLHVANETGRVFRGTVCWAFRGPDSSVLREGAFPCEVQPYSGLWLPRLDANDIDPLRIHLSYALLDESGKTVSAGAALFCAPKHYAFMDPQLSLRQEGDSVTVTTDVRVRPSAISSVSVQSPDLRRVNSPAPVPAWSCVVVTPSGESSVSLDAAEASPPQLSPE